MTDKGKAKDKAAKAKFAKGFPDLMHKIVITAGGNEEMADQASASASTIFARHAPNE